MHIMVLKDIHNYIHTYISHCVHVSVTEVRRASGLGWILDDYQQILFI